MEPLSSECPTSETDIVNVGNVECTTPSTVTSNAGNDCSISNTKVVATAEGASEKRNDATLRPMGHLIPGFTEPEEDVASETDSSTKSTPSTLKRRLKNLPSSIEAVKLADRVAAVNRRVRKERDLYLHLQGVTNRIEEKDEAEVSTTDSSRTLINSEPNRRHQGQVSKARARRRERLNSSLAMSQYQLSSDFHLCSSRLSSPEPLTLREIEYAHSKEDSIICNSSSEANNSQVRATYLTPKRTPTKFGGYRPTSGLIFRNLSSDSESEVTSERIAHNKLHCEKFQGEEMTSLEIQDAEEETLRGRHFISSNLFPNPDRIMQVEPLSVEEIEALESRLISPIFSADSSISFEESSQMLQTFSELQIPQKPSWESMSPDERNHYMDAKIGNVVERNTLVDSSSGHFDDGQFMEVDLTDSFSKEEDFTYGNRRKISLEPLHRNHVSFSKQNPQTTFPTLRSSQAQSLAPARDSTADLVIQNENHGSEHLRLANTQSGDDSTDDNVQPKIPPLDIDYSQSQSLSSDARDETTRPSLDVNALIQALSDVSIKQEKNSTYRTNRSIVKLKSPLGYGSKFSGSSGPRSSEYTPAAGGSRQSLTSQEASETHSVRNYKAQLRSRVKVESNEKSGMCVRDEPLEDDSSRGNGFIPVVAKVDRTNLVCPEHPLRVKSIGKLISPRKYPNTGFGEKIVVPLTSRTDASQSSEECRKSLRSLKTVPVDFEVPEKRIDGLRPSTDSPNQPVTLPGRRILEPLNSVLKNQPDSLSSLNRKFNRRRKTTNDLAEIISSQSEAGSGRAACSSRQSPLSQSNKVDLPIHRFAQRRENSSMQSKDSPETRSKSLIRPTEVSSGRRTQGEPFDNISRPSTKCDHELLEESMKSGKISCASSEISSVTSGNMLYLRSERRSMSSGDCEGRINWSSPSRDDELTGNDDTYNLEDKLHAQQQRVGANCKVTYGVSDLDSQDARSPKFAPDSLAQESAGSFRNCVHLDDLQNGREVTLPCRDTRCREDALRERELFKHLPNEISTSLTRHGSFGKQVTENLHSRKETPSTFEDLKKNIQENNDQWIKNFKSDNDLRHIIPGNSSGFSPDDKLALSASSPVRFRNTLNQSRNSIRNQTRIPQKIPFIDLDSHCSQPPQQKTIEPTDSSCFRTSMTSKIDPGSSRCSSPLYRDIRQESEYSNESGYLDSQRSSLINSGANSHRNTNRGIVESLASKTVLKFDQKVNREHDGHDKEALSLTIACAKSVSEHVAKALEPSKLSKVESFITETVPNSEFEFILDTAFECPESEELEKSGVSEKDREKIEEQNVCEKNSSSSSNKSAKSQTSTRHNLDAVISPPVKSSLSFSKLNLCTDSKWHVSVLQAGASSVRKSQDRFPFTISESASRKTSKYKVVADSSLDQLMQERNAHVESNDAVLTQEPILEEYQINTKPEIESCKPTPFLEELTNQISNDFPQSWTAERPFMGPNYISYGCRSEPRTLMPTMKEIVKKFSAKLRYSGAKRCNDSEEMNVEILYRNKKCRYESGEGSSSAASLYQSQFLPTNKPIRESNDASRASSANAVKLKRNHECINMSMEQRPRRGCDQNDLWIQEFDPDVEFDGQEKTEAMHGTSSPVNDRYSIFLARRAFSGIINEEEDHNDRLNICEGGDNEKVTSKRTNSDDKLLSQMQDLLSKCPMPPPNSTNEFEIQTKEDDLDDSTAKSGCCCFRIYHFFATSRKHRSKS